MSVLGLLGCETGGRRRREESNWRLSQPPLLRLVSFVSSPHGAALDVVHGVSLFRSTSFFFAFSDGFSHIVGDGYLMSFSPKGSFLTPKLGLKTPQLRFFSKKESNLFQFRFEKTRWNRSAAKKQYFLSTNFRSYL